jgi:hypothetical protein
MNFLVLIAIFIIGVSTVSVIDPKFDDDWNTFKNNYKKAYKTKDHEKSRRLKYENNANIIAQHNKEAESGKQTFKLAMNEFGDMVGF